MNQAKQTQTKLIIGANSDIAKAIALQLTNEPNTQLIVVSRDVSFYQASNFKNLQTINVADYTESSIIKAVAKINSQVGETVISSVFICHGLLHNANCFPEKKLEDFNPEAFLQIVTANTVTPMLWLKSLIVVLPKTQECQCVVFIPILIKIWSFSEN